ncbi:hypothetical protein CUMW_274450 [Citrus unshiu]|uniref:Uncharacterized protein n=1 Tax=Citrus unshiu TaxID=55188 RepID=A0A2H5MZA1_CITUN|nr:hypothetical protein CUMW_274450 [Citrus unshiu]
MLCLLCNVLNNYGDWVPEYDIPMPLHLLNLSSSRIEIDRANFHKVPLYAIFNLWDVCQLNGIARIPLRSISMANFLWKLIQKAFLKGIVDSVMWGSFKTHAGWSSGKLK